MLFILFKSCIYILLANFDKVYDKISDEEKKSLISSLIKEIEIFLCDESELPLKSILFNFPVYKNGGDVYEFLWDKSTHVSTCPAQGNTAKEKTPAGELGCELPGGVDFGALFSL